MAKPKIIMLVSEYLMRFPKKIEFEYERRALVYIARADYTHHFHIGIDQFNLERATKYIAYHMQQRSVGPKEYAVLNGRKLDIRRQLPLKATKVTSKLFENIKSSLDRMMGLAS